MEFLLLLSRNSSSIRRSPLDYDWKVMRLFGGKIDAENSQVEVNTSSRAAILAKGEYYLI